MDADGIIGICEMLGIRAGHPYTPARRGPHISIGCPLAHWNHEDPEDYNRSCSVTINPDGPSLARCHSFNCDFRGSFFQLIQSAVIKRPNPSEQLKEMLKHLNEVEDDSIEKRAERCAVKIDAKWEDLKVVTPKSLPPGWNADVLAESALEPFSGTVPRYCLQRGISLEAAKAWDLGYDTRLGRLVFPVRRFDGALIGMTGRILPEAEYEQKMAGREPTKYHNYSGLNKTLYLYGAHLWKKNLPVVIVEGPIDCIRTWMALKDIANVGATLGQGFSESHRRIIKAVWPPGVYIFGDADSAGRRMAEKVQHRLNGAVPMFLMLCPMRTEVDTAGVEHVLEQDPGELEDPQIVEAFHTASPILDRIDWRPR